MKEAFIKSNFWIGLLAFSVAFPIFIVGSSWLLPGSELWSHFAQTLLPELITSTLILLIGVGIGVSVLGTVLAYLVVMVDFPGRSWLEWALFLPFGIPAYVLAWCFRLFRICSSLVKRLSWYPWFRYSFRALGNNINFHSGLLPLCLYDGQSIF